jgi:chaperone modulatory protein CbpM
MAGETSLYTGAELLRGEAGMDDETKISGRLQGVTIERLQVWVQKGWIRPTVKAGEPYFTKADMARAAFVHDLQELMELDEETVPIVLKLIDQIHGLRRELKMLLQAIDQQPESVREQIRSYRLEQFTLLAERETDSA